MAYIPNYIKEDVIKDSSIFQLFEYDMINELKCG